LIDLVSALVRAGFRTSAAAGKAIIVAFRDIGASRRAKADVRAI
jgi:hypothetical protein